MAKKEKKAAGGSDIPEWLVTFADLMSILVAFFVLIISFSVQDSQKLQIVAGSMQDAFGVIKKEKRAGIIEKDGSPLRKFVKTATDEETLLQSDFSNVDQHLKNKQGQEANTFETEQNEIEKPNTFALAATTLRQAWQDLPEITFIADNLLIEETDEGLHIQIVDQEGRSMFPEGSKYPFEATRKAISVLAPIFRQLPNLIRVSGHTASGATYTDPRYGPWDLSTDRANVVRAILTEFGFPSHQYHSIVGKGDIDPLFPNDPYLASNRRISILIMTEEPPVPRELKP